MHEVMRVGAHGEMAAICRPERELTRNSTVLIPWP
jgi:hypothetical protein